MRRRLQASGTAITGVIARVGWGSYEPGYDRLRDAAPAMYGALVEAPVLSHYHGVHGFEVERFIADYEWWRQRAVAALDKADGRAR